MPFSLTWLHDVLKTAGLKVAPEGPWQERGRGEIGPILGVMCHHTGTKGDGNMPTLTTLVKGRDDLPGPLAQLGLGRDGTYFIVAAGRANHAGKGKFKGVKDRGNQNFIGIEAEHSGRKTDPWPDIQMDAYRRGVAAILKHLRLPVDVCIGHKEYAPGRKPDPTFDMDEFRAAVAAIMRGETPPLPPIPRTDSAGRLTLRRGATGDLVKKIQAKVGVSVDGNFGPKTEAAVRVFQRAHNLVPDGIVGPKTWDALQV